MIELCSTNTQTIMVERRHKEEVTQKPNILFNVLEKRNEFNEICGNTSKFGVKIDKFTITQSGQNYLSFLKCHNIRQSDNSQSSQSEENSLQGKQKLHHIITTNNTTFQTVKSTISPIYIYIYIKCE